MKQGTSLHTQLIRIAEDYFGPAASRFVDRLISNHLKKEPAQLGEADLPELIKWASLTCALLTDDPRTLAEFTERLANLQQPALVPEVSKD